MSSRGHCHKLCSRCLALCGGPSAAFSARRRQSSSFRILTPGQLGHACRETVSKQHHAHHTSASRTFCMRKQLMETPIALGRCGPSFLCLFPLPSDQLPVSLGKGNLQRREKKRRTCSDLRFRRERIIHLNLSMSHFTGPWDYFFWSSTARLRLRPFRRHRLPQASISRTRHLH